MRKPYFAAAMIIGVVAVIAGCGQAVSGARNAADASRTSSAPASSPAASGSAAPPSTPASGTGNGGLDLGCAPPPAGSVPGQSLMLSQADMGRAYCVNVGEDVLVFLHGTPAMRWAPIHVGSSVLQPRASGRMMLALGVTGASFTAVRPGTAIITSYRPACSGSVPTGDNGTDGVAGTMGGASPPTMMCGALIGFRVTVVVR